HSFLSLWHWPPPRVMGTQSSPSSSFLKRREGQVQDEPSHVRDGNAGRSRRPRLLTRRDVDCIRTAQPHSEATMAANSSGYRHTQFGIGVFISGIVVGAIVATIIPVAVRTQNP